MLELSFALPALLSFSLLDFNYLAKEANTGSPFKYANAIYLFVKIFLRGSLNCKLVPVKFLEYKYGPLFFNL